MNDENEFTANGKTYEAQESENCEGCAFLKRDEHGEFCEPEDGAPWCTRHARADGRNVIFVVASNDRQVERK